MHHLPFLLAFSESLECSMLSPDTGFSTSCSQSLEDSFHTLYPTKSFSCTDLSLNTTSQETFHETPMQMSPPTPLYISLYSVLLLYSTCYNFKLYFILICFVNTWVPLKFHSPWSTSPAWSIWPMVCQPDNNC